MFIIMRWGEGFNPDFYVKRNRNIGIVWKTKNICEPNF